MGHAEAYKDDGTPEEQSRRTFMVNAVIALGGVISLGIAIPLVTSLIPPSGGAQGEWSPLTADEAATLAKASETPIKATFQLHDENGYFGASDSEQFVWAVKATEAQMRELRPQLFGGVENVPYPVVTMGFAIFSPICPHLGCKYAWIEEQKKFVCPCHGSVYSNLGAHEAGPALRGLDPLPLRDFQGKVELTWIEYKQGVPNHIILKVG